ncbi:MAG: acyltransferase [Sphaerochaetaceae bacterium]|nr:acyltransferase [Sphaerochaetaceae bacterium]
MIKKILIFIFSIFNKIFNYLILKRKRVIYGLKLNIQGKLHLHGNGKFIFGNRVTINSSHNVNPVAGGAYTHLSSYDGAVINIGNNVGISHSAITAMQMVTIGDNTLIGSNSMICDTDFHSLITDIRISNDSNPLIAAVNIGKNVFIGARSIILKGVQIGDNSIIGAGSVVTKSIPSNEVWAGNPARFIRKVDVI